MFVIGVAVQEADGEALDLVAREVFRERLNGRLVQGGEDLPIRVDPLGHRIATLPRDQHVRLVDENVVLVVAPLVGDLENISEALGGDDAHPGALALDQRVGRQRRAVNDGGNLRRGQRGPLEGQADARDHGLRRIA